MTKNYYFVSTLLPPLKIGTPPELGSWELAYLLKGNLSQEDYQKVLQLRRLVDIENLRRMWKHEPLDPGGNLDEKEIEDKILLREGLPKYVFDYLDRYTNTQEKIKHFPVLLRTFFKEEVANSKPSFVHNYLRFEWEWRLVFVALRAKKLGRDIKEELANEDPEDPFIEQLLTQADSKHFEPPAPYEGLKALYESRKDSPIDLYQAIEEWRFNQIEEVISWQTFSLTKILGYVAQLSIIEKWLELDKRKGLEFIEKMLKERT